jgi:hypothetical protein
MVVNKFGFYQNNFFYVNYFISCKLFITVLQIIFLISNRIARLNLSCY